ncbi:MAG: DegT/DnrJ/EryC1/StrS family aminotransferase [Mycobacterium sp.]|uniref:DegT/DnrJ/EryC1/StrS family aminotransferase n=1 Tax=Mycobacterium sp. TaxID=1785 RepID=UPI001ED4826C|nr:DegT/DnrJ/EryC1/StrS family aminotransferase [Mycobacterium sp.]MBV8786788.1 DegT/DnrJ/EryC1/StrS family aminotransferase [Mycobacterium sp.]MBV9997038.1 DegT/DnrJ/EryC1/StrS family aminotransferase [Caulobacteraceae bacterium]
MNVPFFSLGRQHKELGHDLGAAAKRVIASDSLILGPQTARFEAEFAAYCGVRHAIGVGNGLDALTLILRGLDIGPGDEVIVPGHTFVATWLAVTHAGATIVPADIDLGTYNIDAGAVAAAITPRTRAIIAVHLYGRPVALDRLADLAAAHGVALIEDAAQAHGATWRGRRVGSLGRAAAFSFYPTKNLGALGDGGAVTTNDVALAERVRRLRSYGSEKKYCHEEQGVNSRLDELQAAFLLEKLTLLDRKNARRGEIARLYGQLLSGLPGLTLPSMDVDAEAVWHLYVVRTTGRATIQQALAQDCIGSLIHYPLPPHRQPAYSRTPLANARLPRSDLAAEQVLSLPMWPEMTDDEVAFVAAAVRRAAIEECSSAAE